MGRGVLAAGMAGSEPGLGAGDTFGISCGLFSDVSWNWQ